MVSRKGINYTHIFDYDRNKSFSNLLKHGIDFVCSQKLWDDPNVIEVQTKYTEESRYIVIGMIGRKHWSAIITFRGERIRIISVRRSRVKEVELYENQEI